MARYLFGAALEDVLTRVGSLDQVARIDSFVEDDGPARGARRIRVVSGGGLDLEIHPDRSLDLGAVSYRGVPVAWIASPGITNPHMSEPQRTGWLRTFGGGLLTTCGLDSFGPPSDGEGEHYPMHGRVGNIPSRVEETRVASDVITVRGTTRQTRVFGENLVLSRAILVDVGGSAIRVEDVVTNEGFTSAGHMILYHCNLGWPLLSEEATLEIGGKSLTPRDDTAAAGVVSWNEITAPQSGFAEQVFRHDFEGVENGHAVIENPRMNLRFELGFDTSSLPGLHQWKMMGEGHYVMGLEPTNVNWSLGRAAAEEARVLPSLEPGESVEYSLEFRFSSLESDG